MCWLGKTSDPSTPAGSVANLGHDLFLTKGVSPTRWERFGWKEGERLTRRA
jgi:hypothetical protein